MNIMCVSHLRWDFVFQRPQHLLSRAARSGRVWYVEEFLEDDGVPRLERRRDATGVEIVVPRIPVGLDAGAQRDVLAGLMAEVVPPNGEPYVLWYYTPMALPFTTDLTPCAVVFDVMDELSAFAGAPPELLALESQLLDKADVVFTGGQRLFESKRSRHANVHAFPSSVDIDHFARARRGGPEPADQVAIPGVRLGFFGVIDERMDYELLRDVAAARPDWHLILIGPTAKIDPATLPRAANIHYLGAKSYSVLPDYIAGWDVALLPFARNEATRFISPTKTPEYLAAGKPVVSTSIHDVVRPYGQQGLAHIADTAPDFIAAIEAALAEDTVERLRSADAFLTHMSWEGTWTGMRQLIDQAVVGREVALRGLAPARAVNGGERV